MVIRFADRLLVCLRVEPKTGFQKRKVVFIITARFQRPFGSHFISSEYFVAIMYRILSHHGSGPAIT